MSHLIAPARSWSCSLAIVVTPKFGVFSWEGTKVFEVYPDSLKGRKSVARTGFLDFSGGMIRGGFLSVSQRMELLALLRSGRAEQRLARRANALLLLDDGWSCEKLAEALYLDDDTLRGWRKTYDASGLLGLERFEGGGSSSRLDRTREEALKAWIAARSPRSTRQVGVYNRTRIWRCL